MHQKLVPDPFLILVNNPKQPLNARNSFKHILKENYQKALKKLTLFFLSNQVPFNEQDYQKQKGPRNCGQPLLKLQNKFKKISLLVMYYLTKKTNKQKKKHLVVLKTGPLDWESIALITRSLLHIYW